MAAQALNNTDVVNRYCARSVQSQSRRIIDVGDGPLLPK
jgi:hypothetical protein